MVKTGAANASAALSATMTSQKLMFLACGTNPVLAMRIHLPATMYVFIGFTVALVPLVSHDLSPGILIGSDDHSPVKSDSE